MANRKNQNSILVLATLGVYLGLVLVGATPQVLAQAAMTRQFNVKDEIEVKDDLDKKPKEQPSKDQSSSLADFPFAYSDFYFSDYADDIRIAQEMASECPAGCRHKLFYFTSFSPDLERIFRVSDYLNEKGWVDDIRVSKMEIEFSPSHGELNYLQNAFAVPSARDQNLWTTATRLISQKTQVSINPKNLHLVVTTRLARGSLDSLLVTNAK